MILTGVFQTIPFGLPAFLQSILPNAFGSYSQNLRSDEAVFVYDHGQCLEAHILHMHAACLLWPISQKTPSKQMSGPTNSWHRWIYGMGMHCFVKNPHADCNNLITVWWVQKCFLLLIIQYNLSKRFYLSNSVKFSSTVFLSGRQGQIKIRT